MTTFDTPGPISVSVELSVGDIRVVASDRTDTVVDVSPSDPGAESHIRVADQTRVDFSAGLLLVKGPRQRTLGLFSKLGSVDVTIEVPTGSTLRAQTDVGDLRCYGRLDDCRIKTSSGDLEVEEAGRLDLKTGAGDGSVDCVTGDAQVSTGTGRVTIRDVAGAAVVKNSNGDSWIGRVDGDLRVSNSNGDITVDLAGAGVAARTSSGDIQVREVVRGVVELKTAYGDIEVGIRGGTAARLDVTTGFGGIRNELDATDGPEASGETAEITADTSYGDILIRRAGGGGGTDTGPAADTRATHDSRMMRKGER